MQNLQLKRADGNELTVLQQDISRRRQRPGIRRVGGHRNAQGGGQLIKSTNMVQMVVSHQDVSGMKSFQPRQNSVDVTGSINHGTITGFPADQ
jgi:hypothetical protein